MNSFKVNLLARSVEVDAIQRLHFFRGTESGQLFINAFVFPLFNHLKCDSIS